MRAALAIPAIALILLAFMVWSGQSAKPEEKLPPAPVPPGSEELVVGAGCFWCIETLFERLKGVSVVEAGYAGGARPNVSYEAVSTGVTGHAEVVRVIFDPKVIGREDLLRIFFTAHDPTTLNQQGPDFGPQYRSAIFFANEAERETAMKIKQEISAKKLWRNPIVTTIEPLRNYTRAEEYHQDYYAKFETAGPMARAGMNSGYCRAIIEPKVAKFRKQFAHMLKE